MVEEYKLELDKLAPSPRRTSAYCRILKARE